MTLALPLKTRPDLITAFALSALLVLIFSVFQGHIGFNLWDEGFLWYGAQRTMLGEVPLRDFMAYDPGRYYWSAAVMSTAGDSGIMALRLSIDFFQVLGTFVGLAVITRTVTSCDKRSLSFLLLCGLVFTAWMFPRHKIFDLSLSIFLAGALSLLIENPTGRRYLLAGFVTGLAAFFGRNHGVYGAFASLGVMLWIRIRPTGSCGFLRGGLLWIAGVTGGFAPTLLMMAFTPGFSSAFWESIRLLFEVKTTNIPLPVPWPWNTDYSSLSFSEAGRQFLIGLLFVCIPVAGSASIVWAFVQRLRGKTLPAPYIAASFLALPYAHYAYSRADVSHLAQGLFPFLIGYLTLASVQSKRLKWGMGLTLATASFWVMSGFQPMGQCTKAGQCAEVEISGSTLAVDINTANDIRLIRDVTEKYAPDGQNVLVVPFWPGAYPLLDRKSPMWTIYALWPRTIDFQQQEIEKIKESAPKLAFVFNLALDGKEELRFKNTYPLIEQYIRKNFDPVGDSPISAYEIYKAKEPKP